MPGLRLDPDALEMVKNVVPWIEFEPHEILALISVTALLFATILMILGLLIGKSDKD